MLDRRCRRGGGWACLLCHSLMSAVALFALVIKSAWGCAFRCLGTHLMQRRAYSAGAAASSHNSSITVDTSRYSGYSRQSAGHATGACTIYRRACFAQGGFKHTPLQQYLGILAAHSKTASPSSESSRWLIEGKQGSSGVEVRGMRGSCWGFARSSKFYD